MRKVEGKYAFGKAGPFVVNVLLFIFSGSLALNLARAIRLPFSNPYSISNLSNIDHFNPENNFVQILVAIVLTIGLFYFLQRLMSTREGLARIYIVIFLSFSLFLFALAPFSSGYYHKIDVFHQGEQLAPALALIHHEHLYSQIFFLHGAGEDAVIPALSFKFFGRSIGSYFFLIAILKLFSAVLFLMLINKLIKHKDLFMVVALWFFSNIYSTAVSFYNVRDIPVWISLFLTYRLIFSPRDSWRYWSLIFIQGVIGAGTFFYSLDRGIFLFFLNLILGMIILFMNYDRSHYSFSIKPWRPKLFYLSGFVVSYLLVFISALAVLGLVPFKAFLKMSFIDTPRYGGLLFGIPLPNIDSSGLLVWLPLIIFTLVILLAIEQLKPVWRRPTPNAVFTVLLIAFSLIFFRAASGRPDLGHIAYATPVMFITIFYILQSHIELLRAKWSLLIKNWALVLALALLVLTPSYSLLRLPSVNQRTTPDLANFWQLPSTKDEVWLSPEVKNVRNFILNNTTKNDGLFVFSNQPLYYYLTDLRNPTRFYITWFADPEPYTQEVLRALKAHPPKYIIYSTNTPVPYLYDTPDGVPMSVRLPEVNDWILKNYPSTTYVGQTTIRSR